MDTLNYNWKIIASVEGGEILGKQEDGRISLSFPDSLPVKELQKILSNAGIEFDDVAATYHAGEGPNETVAIWNVNQ